MSKPNPEPVALLVADIHLSLRPPVWRSNEPDWLEAMKRPLKELKELQDNLDSPPIIYAGDIFDKWYGAHQSSELVNFAIDNLPRGYAIPGQHDLPNHSMEEIHRSAYYTLVQAGIIQNLTTDNHLFKLENPFPFLLHCFPFGTPMIHRNIDKREKFHVSIAHEYVWIKNRSYQGAPDENKITNARQNLDGYDIAVFGDNHIGFQTKIRNTTIWNCGGFMRRKSDEVNYKPRIGILYDDKTAKPHYLDISKDINLPSMDLSENGHDLDFTQLIKELETLGDCGLDFKEAMKQYIVSKNVSKPVATILMEAMGI